MTTAADSTMIRKGVQYVIENIEYCIVAFILAGLIAFNKAFAYIGIGSLYITESLTAICVLSLSLKYLFSIKGGLNDLKEMSKSLLADFWPLLLITGYAVVLLIQDVDYGFHALRHSLIFLYTVLFLLLFTMSIKTERQLFFLLFYLLIVFSSCFNGLKIIIYKLLNLTFNYYEPERVLHNETDTICASVALLGLLVYRKIFWSKSRLLFITLILLNVTILVLTVKRSAAIGIVPSVLVYLFLTRKTYNIKQLLLATCILCLAILCIVAAWYLADADSFYKYTGYILHKLSLTEKNANWRLEAWKVGWEKFKEAPLTGIGYGKKIIELPVANVDTSDPHNSFLAFLVRHGTVFFCVYITFIIKTYYLLFKEIRNSDSQSLHFLNAVMICLGLTSLIVFAFFNVVLENQYEGIFFNFFLSGIYVIRTQRREKNQVGQHAYAPYLSYLTLITVAGFLSIAFAPFNKTQRIYLYSATTNYSLPSIPLNTTYTLNVNSQKGVGITIHPTSDELQTEKLLWFFPPQANSLNLADYEIRMETNVCSNDIRYFLLYEDERVTELESVCVNNTVQVSLGGISETSSTEVKIKYFIVTVTIPAGVTPGRNGIIVKNIYINHK